MALTFESSVVRLYVIASTRATRDSTWGQLQTLRAAIERAIAEKFGETLGG